MDAPTSFQLLSPVMLRRTLGGTKARLLRPCLRFRVCTPRRCLSQTCRSTPECYTSVMDARVGGSRIVLGKRVPTEYVRRCEGSLACFAGKRKIYLARLGKCRPTVNGFVYRPHHPGDHVSGIQRVFRGLTWRLTGIVWGRV